MFDRLAIRPACERAGITLREWQRQALHRCTLEDSPDRHIVTAIMGAGKSVVIALLCASWRGPVVVTAPTIALVEQLSATIEHVTGEPVGQLYTGAKTTARITVVCLPSIELAPTEPGTLWIADECHRTERAPVGDYDAHPVHRIGFSATPYRADDGGLSLWTGEHLRYTVGDALTDSVLVPMRVHYLTGSGLVDRNQACIDWVAAQDGPGVVSADSIADAESFCEALQGAGVPTLCVHSRMPRKAQRNALRALEGGSAKALVHVRMLVEGVDLPWLRWLCLRTPRGSRVAYSQEIGRVLRSHPGKTHADIFDPYGVTLEHELQDAAAVCDAATGIEAAEPEQAPEPFIDPLTGEEFERPTKVETKRILARSEGAAYIAQCVTALKMRGVVPPGSSAAGLKGWRRDPATARQMEMLDKAAKQCRYFVQQRGEVDGRKGRDAEHARAIATQVVRALGAAKMRPILKGYASDLITVLLSTIRTGDNNLKAAAHAAIRDIEAPE
jgi:superfamily II DNA or RNA helicase